MGVNERVRTDCSVGGGPLVRRNTLRSSAWGDERRGLLMVRIACPSIRILDSVDMYPRAGGRFDRQLFDMSSTFRHFNK